MKSLAADPDDLAFLAASSGLDAAEIAEIVDYGTVRAGAGYAQALREAARLRRLFDLDLFTVSLLAGYLHRIDLLERELKALKAASKNADPAPARDGPSDRHEPHD